MADSILEVEKLVKVVAALIKDRFNVEKEAGEFTKFLPKLPAENVYAGRPAVVMPQIAVAVLASREEPRRDGQVGCPYRERAFLRIYWWYHDLDFEQDHEMIWRMAEVIKRILLRNPRLVKDFKGHAHDVVIESLNYGDPEVFLAFAGERVAYGRGDLLLRVELCEVLELKE